MCTAVQGAGAPRLHPHAGPEPGQGHLGRSCAQEGGRRPTQALYSQEGGLRAFQAVKGQALGQPAPCRVLPTPPLAQGPGHTAQACHLLLGARPGGGVARAFTRSRPLPRTLQTGCPACVAATPLLRAVSWLQTPHLPSTSHPPTAGCPGEGAASASLLSRSQLMVPVVAGTLGRPGPGSEGKEEPPALSPHPHPATPSRAGRADPGGVQAAGGGSEEGDEADAEGDGPRPEAGDSRGGQREDAAHLRALHPRRLRYHRQAPPRLCHPQQAPAAGPGPRRPALVSSGHPWPQDSAFFHPTVRTCSP